MSIKLTVPTPTELKPRIVVFGVGGAGGNAVNNMINSALEGVEFVVANTDAQALANSSAQRRIQLGIALTEGLGAGSRPDVGRDAAEEALEQIVQNLQGSHMAFITAGMGGGTGTGAAPVIARAAKELNILTVGVVTKPFQFEGNHRMRIAEAGIEELQRYVDTLIIIPNQNLFRVANEKTTFADAFKMADNVLHSGVRGITDLMVMPGLINLDFADVRAVMSEMGKAMMGTGEADGDKRALEAAERAIANPLLDDISMKGARGVLINITGGPDLTLFEVDEAANRIRGEVDPEANIIVGSTLDGALQGRMRVSVVATGIDAEIMAQPRPSATVTPMVRPTPTRLNVGPMTHSIGQAALAVAQPIMAAPNAQAVEQRRVQTTRIEPAAARKTAVDAAETVTSPVRPQFGAVERREAPFIPPRPVESPIRRESLFAPDTFREPELGNASSDSTKVRKPSLFERVTGVGRGRGIVMSQSKNNAAEPKIVRGQAAVSAQPAISVQPQPAPAPNSARSPGQSNVPISTAPTSSAELAPALSGLEPADRLAPWRMTDDLLDIPAFLRRQSN